MVQCVLVIRMNKFIIVGQNIGMGYINFVEAEAVVAHLIQILFKLNHPGKFWHIPGWILTGPPATKKV